MMIGNGTPSSQSNAPRPKPMNASYLISNRNQYRHREFHRLAWLGRGENQAAIPLTLRSPLLPSYGGTKALFGAFVSATLVPEIAMDQSSFNSPVSWGAILAGAFTAAAVSLIVVAFGVGVGLSVVSPWTGEGISATTASWSASLFLVAVAMVASTFGG